MYIIVLGILFTIADFALSFYLRNKSRLVEYQAWNHIYNDTLENDLVILGSSRAYVHFNPRIIDSVLSTNSYNLGYNAALVNRQIARYDTYCRVQNHQPEYIIYTVDYMTLHYRDNFEREQFYPYFFYDREFVETFDKYENFSAIEKYAPFVRYTKCLFDFHVYTNMFDPMENHTLYKGYWNEHYEYDNSVLAGIQHLDYTYTDEALALFENFVDRETKKGVQIVIVYAPLYHELIHKISNFQDQFTVYGRIAEKYGIPVLDYTNDELSYSQEYFYNATHLNKRGAHIFSRKFAADLKELNIIKK